MKKKLIMLMVALGMCTTFTACDIAGLDFTIQVPGMGGSSQTSTGSSSTTDSSTGSSVAEQNVTVTFKQSGQANVTKTVEKGSNLTDIPSPKAKTGYTVDPDWYVDEACTTKATFENLQENLTVFAKMTANKYMVSYNANGGTVATLTQEVTFDAPTTLAVPEREDYLFTGWTYNGNAVVDGAAWTFAENVELVASWQDQRPEYTVTFVDGTQSKPVTVKKGESVPAEEVPAFVGKVGYTVKWDKTDFTNVTGNMTVTAEYTPITYTVTYSVGGTVQLTYGEKCTNLEVLTSETQNFLGWTYNGKTYTTDSVWDVAEENVVLTASWAAKDQVIVFFKDTDGSTITKAIYQGQTLTDIPTPSAKTGYNVDTENWYTDETYAQAASFENLQESMTVYAKATAKTYTVTYNANGGNAVENLTVTYNKAYTLATPTHAKNYMQFMGWKDAAGNMVAMSGEWKKDGGAELVAEWKDMRAEFTVTFVDGTQSKSVTVRDGDGVPAEEVPAFVGKVGHTAKWDKTDFTNITGNITVTAVYTPITYTVTYSVGGTVQLTYGQPCTALEVLTSETQNFLGWTYNGKTYTTDSVWDVAEENVVLTASWATKDQVVVTFKNTNGDVTKMVYVGQTLTDIPAPAAKTGYNVDSNWYTDETYTQVASFENLTAGMTVYAKATAKTYTVTYDANGGNAVEALTVTYDKAYTLATPTHALGYMEFTGWYNGGVKVENGVWKNDGDMTLVAEWKDTRAIYTIKFVQEGQPTQTFSVKAGENLTEQVSAPVQNKVGYTITWDRTDFTNINENITVGVIETANKYTVTYSAEGYNVNGTTIELTYGQPCTNLAVLTSETQNFLGWTYNGKTYTATSTWDVAEENVVLTASWAAKDQVVVTFKNTNGDDTRTVYVGQTLTDIPTPAAKTGYTVDTENWYIDEGCTTKATFTALQASMTVYAKATANKYTVSYNANGGTVATPTQEVTYDAPTTLAVPEREDYLFTGWTYNGNAVVDGAKWSFAENVELVATWQDQRPEYTVTFVDGTQSKSVTVKKGEGVPAEEVPAFVGKVGYTVKWDKTDFTNVTGNMTVTAEYTPITYTVTYSVGGTVQLTYGEKCTNLAVLTSETQNFLGWTYNGKTYTTDSVWDVAEENVVLTASWATKDQVVVTFKNTNGDVTKMVYVGQTLTDIPAPAAKTGYNVDSNWYTDETYTQVASFENLTAGMTVYAKATAKTYTVKYNANGGNAVEALTVTYDKEYTLATPTHALGYMEFTGWYNNGVKVENGVWTNDGDMTLTAEWKDTRATYTITFVQNGATVKTFSVKAGENLTEELPTPEQKTGYTITWDRTDFTNINENVTVGVIETANKYTVTYSANGYDVNGTTVQLTYGQPCTALAVLTSQTENFLGWTYGDKTYTTDSVWDVAENVTLTASWTAKAQVTVTFKNTNGDETRTVYVGQTLTDIPTPSAKTGYNVDSNWYTDETYTQVASFENLTAGMTVYAKATAKTYTVKYNANGGNAVADLTVTYDKEYTLATPTHELSYMEFTGWYNGGVKVENGVWTNDGDMTLTAEWKDTRATYTITFVQEGQPTQTFTIKAGESFTAIPDPVQKTGYTITWNKDKLAQLNEVSGNVEVTADVVANVYLITLNANGGTAQTTITVTYGKAYELPEPSHEEYAFDCWLYNGKKIELTGTWEIDAQNIELVAKWGASEWTDNY